MTAHSSFAPRRVLITGATGYLGRALIKELVARSHSVRALVRSARHPTLPETVEIVVGNPLQADDVARALEGCDTLVHLVGVPKPNPSKAEQFRRVDLVSIQASVAAAVRTQPRPHVIYLSVAHPAPVMKAYIEVRQAGEALLRQHDLPTTFLRPWYVLGPGHQWPRLLLPFYWLLRCLPPTRPSALRLGFVTLEEMTTALVSTVESPPVVTPRILEVPEIRERSRTYDRGQNTIRSRNQ